jgi:hypothetical protein
MKDIFWAIFLVLTIIGGTIFIISVEQQSPKRGELQQLIDKHIPFFLSADGELYIGDDVNKFKP